MRVFTLIFVFIILANAQDYKKLFNSNSTYLDRGKIQIKITDMESALVDKRFDQFNSINNRTIAFNPHHILPGKVVFVPKLVGLKLNDGSFHDVDSNEMAFKIAGSMALKNGARVAGAVILEPVFSIEVVVPEVYMGDVIGDLNSRRGKISGILPRKDVQVISGTVPLSEMFGYATTLRSATQGRAIYSMQFDHYDKVPESIAKEIVEKSQSTDS